MTAISLHIGLNEVDPSYYTDRAGRPWKGVLGACENDAQCMAEMAAAQGIDVRAVLLTKAATRSAVLDAMADAATGLTAGDLLWLTYSGHGAQVANTNVEFDPEDDNLDETWCLYDRQVIDDELHDLYCQFAPGVRIVVFSDSCHSGSVTRGEYGGDSEPGMRAKQPPDDVVIGTEEAHADENNATQRAIPAKRLLTPTASVVLLSGCQDKQLSRDGETNGAFTAAIIESWQDPKARTSLRALHAAAAAHIPARYDQTPNYFTLGSDITGPALSPD